ncbi:hypothetical protein GCM10010313_75370 [Streptomyces violarus]|nr:hypothetical protein GCM10010313_75370 [Streptomyces violarus]
MPYSAWCARAYQPPYARAADASGITAAGFSRGQYAVVVREAEEPAEQERRQIPQRGTETAVRRLPHELEGQNRAQGEQQHGDGGEPEEPQQERGEEHEPQVRPQVPEDLPGLFAPGIARRVAERHHPVDAEADDAQEGADPAQQPGPASGVVNEHGPFGGLVAAFAAATAGDAAFDGRLGMHSPDIRRPLCAINLGSDARDP